MSNFFEVRDTRNMLDEPGPGHQQVKPRSRAEDHDHLDRANQGAASIKMDVLAFSSTSTPDLVGNFKARDKLAKEDGKKESKTPHTAHKNESVQAKMVRYRQLLLRRRLNQHFRAQELRRIHKFRRQAVLVYARTFLDGTQWLDMNRAVKEYARK